MTTLSVAILASSLKASLTVLSCSCSVFARGGRLHLIDGGDGESDDERTVYDGDAPTDDVSPASGAAEASSASPREDRRLPSWDGGESDHGRDHNQKIAQSPPRGGDRVREARARRHSGWGALPGVVGYGAVGADPHQAVHEGPGVPRGIVRGFVLALADHPRAHAGIRETRRKLLQECSGFTKHNE